MNNRQVVVCVRTKDLPVPYVPSRILLCVECGERVWQDLGSPPAGDAVCVACVMREAAESSETIEVRVTPEVRDQMRALGYSDEAIEAMRRAFYADLEAKARRKGE